MSTRPTTAPRIDELRLDRLDDGDPTALTRRADLEGFRFADVTLERLDLADAVVAGSRLERFETSEADLRGCRLSEVDLEAVNVPVVRAARGEWRDVRVSGRLGSVEAYESEWRGVHFVGCKLSYVNLRSAQLQDILFTDCAIEELDLAGARLRRVRLAETRVRHLDVQHSDLEHVDLRGATLESIDGLTHLRGAVVTSDQLTLLAPLLAAGIGLRVED